MELQKYARSVTAQWGEDGVIAEIFKRIGRTSSIAVEFGSWDGKHLSNVWDLWHNQGWGAVLIESDTKRHEACQQEYATFTKVHFVNAFVEPKGPRSLDNILKKTIQDAVPDIVSIDIDGNDYYILESLTHKLPRVLVVEFNPTIPPHLAMVQKPGEYFGASALALKQLAKQKGYRLVYITKTNLIFVADKEFSKLKIKEVELTLDTFPSELIGYVVTSYNGTPFLVGESPYIGLKPLPAPLDDPAATKHAKLASSSTEHVVPVRIFKAQ